LKQKKIEVLVTRSHDQAIELDQRTTYANNKDADLFVSIHANYAANKSAHGIETFCFNNNLLKKNRSTLSQEELQTIRLHSLMRERDSKKLADTVHHMIINSLQKDYPIKDRRVKNAVSQVLMGSHMPSILIEVGFISNPKEAMRLQNKRYQDILVGAICNGICSFIQKSS